MVPYKSLKLQRVEIHHLLTVAIKREGNLLWRLLGPGSNSEAASTVRTLGRLTRDERRPPAASSSDASPLPVPAHQNKLFPSQDNECISGSQMRQSI